MKQLKIKYVRSSIGRVQKQRKTLQALGLNKLGQEVIQNDNEAIRGMINVVKHLILVEEV